ncbi:MAG TPA: leucine-rich repeat domain-containing protein [Bacteroidales bacterium]|nr:leucine-rich repeat domain-containing protein [Bacteroidales bacterium]
MKKRLFIFVCMLTALCSSTLVSAAGFGRVDNLFEYILKGQAVKYDKVRPDLKPKELELYKNEVEYSDNLRKVMLDGTIDDFYEAYFQSYISVNIQPYKNNIGLICSSFKILPDSLKNMADNKIMAKFVASNDLQVQGRGILAALEKTGYPVSAKYRQTISDLIFNAQYSELLTTPSLAKYRAFMVDWPKSDKIPSVKLNYDDALFAESQTLKDKDIYLLDEVLPNETKKHMVPDDWSILGDKQSDKGEYAQASAFYGKAISLGSKEGLFKLTVLKYDGKIKSDEDELPIFQKLAAIGDARAKEYVFNIQNRTLNMAVEGNLETMLTKKDLGRIVNLTITGQLNAADLKILKDMATTGKLTNLDLAEVSIAKMPERGFQGCAVLTNIILPKGLKIIGNEMFADCTGLTSITLPDSLATIAGSAFNNCSALPELSLPASLTSGLGFTSFCSGCKRLNKLNVAAGNKVYSSLDGVLYNYDKTTILRYPCGNPASLFSFPNTVAEISVGAFEGCVYLSSITMTENLKVIKNAAFKGCNALTSLNVPSMVTEIGGFAFENCNRLTSINLPIFLTEIGNSTFKNCTNLSNVVIPTSIREIRSEAFAGCSNLMAVSLGPDIKGLGDKTFAGCSGLKQITLAQATPLNVSPIFEGVDLNTCVLHVPVGSLAAYQQFPVWSSFTNIVEP